MDEVEKEGRVISWMDHVPSSLATRGRGNTGRTKRKEENSKKLKEDR